jgi:hypothetical protein
MSYTTSLYPPRVPIGPQGPQGPQGPTGTIGAPKLGNVAIVDSINGNDATASVGGSPFLTVNTAVATVLSGQTIWILPGTYTLSSVITLTNGTSIRGLSLQTTVIEMNVTSSTTMITMGENCRIEDLTINLTCTGSTDNVILKGIVFGGSSSQTSKLRTSLLNVRNSTMSNLLTSTVTGVEFLGTGSLNSSSFSFNSLKGSTINVYSNGQGNKRGILVSNSNQASTRDLNVFVSQPSNTTGSTGSYVGIETNDPLNIGSIQIRTTTVGTKLPEVGDTYIASDILQTTPSTIVDPTYLATAGIQVGPGSDLVTKSTGSKAFSTYIYPTIIYYSIRGTIARGPVGGYLWPGTELVSGTYPDATIPPGYFRAQQPTLISGLSAALNIAPGNTNTLTVSIYYTPAATLSNKEASYTGSIAGTTLTVTSAVIGNIEVGQTVSGFGIALNTYIVSGSGATWTVFPSQTIGSIGSPIAITNGAQASSFTGTINNGAGGNGTILTISSGLVGLVAIGQYVAGASVNAGTRITASTSNPSVWTVGTSQNRNGTIYTCGILPTPFTVTFGPTDVQKTFYNASTRINTGDRIHLYVSHTDNPASLAEDLTAQIDLF